MLGMHTAQEAYKEIVQNLWKNVAWQKTKVGSRVFLGRFFWFGFQKWYRDTLSKTKMGLQTHRFFLMMEGRETHRFFEGNLNFIGGNCLPEIFFGGLKPQGVWDFVKLRWSLRGFLDSTWISIYLRLVIWFCFSSFFGEFFECHVTSKFIVCSQVLHFFGFWLRRIIWKPDCIGTRLRLFWMSPTVVTLRYTEDTFIGRAAHIQFLECQPVMRCQLCFIGIYGDPNATFPLKKYGLTEGLLTSMNS